MADPIVVYRWKSINPLDDLLEDPGQREYDAAQMAAAKGIQNRGLPSYEELINRLTDARTRKKVNMILDSVGVVREIGPK